MLYTALNIVTRSEAESGAIITCLLINSMMDIMTPQKIKTVLAKEKGKQKQNINGEARKDIFLFVIHGFKINLHMGLFLPFLVELSFKSFLIFFKL